VPIGVVTYASCFGIYYGLAMIGLAMGWVDTSATNWDPNVMGVTSSVVAIALYFAWMQSSIERAAGLRAG